jgi:hypothetical protein
MAIVGAISDSDYGADSGSAYAFQFDGRSWGQIQKLLASDGNAEDEFGFSVAVDGDTAMISALQHIHFQAAGNGSVYVFRFNGMNWVQEQELLAADGQLGDGFGWSVAISGCVALIGAPNDGDKVPTSGSAYVFRYDPGAGQWVQEQKLLAADGAAADGFGISVAVSGDVAVIGASGDDDCPGGLDFEPGAVYVFRFNAATTQWVQEQKLLLSDCAPSDHFGAAVAASDGTLLAGARLYDDNGPDSGAAYVFRYDPHAGHWDQEQQILATDGQPGDQFGKSVAIDGDTALVGAWLDDDIGNAFGAAYLFRREGSTWVQRQKLLPDPGAWTSFFGWSVALGGDAGIAGAYGENAQRGAAYMYAGLGGGDCNGTGSADSCDILLGVSQDANGDGIPDECSCPWDMDGSGGVGIGDFLGLLAQWGGNPGGPPDFDGSGDVGITDFLDLLAHWGPCL